MLRRSKPLHCVLVCVTLTSGIALASLTAMAEESRFLSEARAAAKAAARDAAPQLALGEALLEARSLKEARRVFQLAARLPEGRALGTYGLAKIQMAQDNIPGARQTCRNLVTKIAKGQPIGYLCEGNAFLAWQRASRAVEGFEKALKIEPGNVDALIGMGDVYRAQMDVSKAEEYYRKVLKSAPGNARAHFGLGTLYLGVDRFADAERELRIAVKNAPHMAEPHYYLGVVLGEKTGGLEELRKAVEVRPDWGEGLEALGQALAKKGNHSEAIPILERAIKAKKNLAGAYQQLGLSHAALKQWPQAEQSLRAAIKLVPSLTNAVLSLGDVLVEQGMHEEAIKTYQQARDLSPRDAQVAMQTGKLYRTLSRNTLARAQFRKASQLDPTLAAAEAALGDIFFEEEDWEEARRHYEDAKSRPNKLGLDQAHLRQRLEQLRQR